MDSLMKYINRIHRCAGQYRSVHLLKARLRPHQHIYIFQICRQPGISQEQLARRICVNKSNVTRQINLLEREGYVTRRLDENDRRISRVYPTESAIALYPQVLQTMQDWNALLFAELSPDEKEQFLQLLDRITRRAIQAVGGEDGLIPDPEEAQKSWKESGGAQL